MSEINRGSLDSKAHAAPITPLSAYLQAVYVAGGSCLIGAGLIVLISPAEPIPAGVWAVYRIGVGVLAGMICTAVCAVIAGRRRGAWVAERISKASSAGIGCMLFAGHNVSISFALPLAIFVGAFGGMMLSFKLNRQERASAGKITLSMSREPGPLYDPLIDG